MADEITILDQKVDPESFGRSAQGNFRVIDSLPTPHYYCITPKHLSQDRIYLDKEAILEAEKKGAQCDTCSHLVKAGEQAAALPYDQHKTNILLVGCATEFGENEDLKKELHTYLLSIKERAEKLGVVGFAFTVEKKEE